jgi:hypothetical protein
MRAMAPPRRGRPRASAFPTELRGTLGTLLRTTLMSARDALERGAREGRARFDDVRLERRRDAAVGELGERVLELVRRGDLPELEQQPEIADALAVIADLDDKLEGRGRDADFDDREPGRDWVTPETRSRFDRGRASSASDSSDSESEDGTVASSAGWRPPAAREPTARVWKPGQIDVKVDEVEIESTRPTRADDTRPLRPRDIDAPRKGGIVFGGDDDDADLADYMHPDDVPAKK